MNHETTITKATYNLIGECSCGDYIVSTSAVAVGRFEADHASRAEVGNTACDACGHLGHQHSEAGDCGVCECGGFDEPEIEAVTYSGHDGRRYGKNGVIEGGSK